MPCTCHPPVILLQPWSLRLLPLHDGTLVVLGLGAKCVWDLRLHGFAPGPCRSLRCCLDSWLSHSPRGALGRLTPKVYEATPDPPPRERCQDHGTPCCGQARTPLGRHHSPAARTVRAAAVALYLARPLLCHPDSSPAFAPEFDQTPSPAPNHSGSRVLKHFLPERSSVQPTSALRPEATQ